MSTVLYGAGPYIAWSIAAAMLVSAAVERHPYSFYILLRWVCCGIFAYSAFAAHEKNRLVWVWIFGALAALYNPIVLVHLDRSTWIGVNWFTVCAIIVGAVAFLPRRAQIWIGAAAGLVFIIASLLWAVTRAQNSASSTSPQVSESGSVTLDFSPEPSSTDPNLLTPIPRAIPRAVPVASISETTPGTANIFDQFEPEALKMIMSFVNALAANDLETQVRYYADSVDYYEFGQVTREVIRKDLQHDITTWPKRVYTVPEPPKFSPDGNGFVAEFPMRYSLANPKGAIGGILRMTVRFELHGGVWRVVGIHRKVIQAAKSVTGSQNEVRKALPAH